MPQDAASALSPDDLGHLPEPDLAKNYVPDIYRCPDCGYEQDVSGTCPDHPTVDLVIIRDKARNPLAPVEYDGTKIFVDIPLKMCFKKEISKITKQKSLTIQKPTQNNERKHKKNYIRLFVVRGVDFFCCALQWSSL